ncbi:MAG: hypothetical protein L0Z53_04720 [Acidobacteriales bacterium]|nr:hypothetical protein [Terriglobales bacterium]
MTITSNSLSKTVRQSVKAMLEAIRAKCRGVDDRTLRQALDKEIKLAIPLRCGPRIAPDVALALRLREENKPWTEIYAAVVDSSLERRTRQAVCAWLRQNVKRHLRRRRLRQPKKRAGRKGGTPIAGQGEIVASSAREAPVLARVE